MTSSKRDQVVEAAHRMFLEHGFGAASMDAIAAEAHVSKRTVYSHFETKDALFREVVSGFCQRMGSAMADTDSQAPIEVQLRQFAEQLIGIILHPEAIATMRTVMAEQDQFPQLAKAFWEAGPAQHLGRLAEILRNCDELEIDDYELAARQYAGAVKGPYFIASLLGVEPPPSQDGIETHIRLTVQGFLKATRKPDRSIA